MSVDKDKYEIKFHREQVYLRVSQAQASREDILKPGHLEVRKGIFGHELAWLPDVEEDESLVFALCDLRSFTRTVPIGGVSSFMVFTLKDGRICPPLEFHKGGTRELIRSFQGLLTYKRSESNQNEYLVCETSPEVVTQAMESLSLFEGASLEPMLHPTSPAVSVFGSAVHYDKAHGRPLLTLKHSSDRAMEGFRKVGKLMRGFVQGEGQVRMSELSVDAEVARMRSEDTLQVVSRDESGFEVLSKKSTLPLIPRPVVTRGPPLSETDWQTHLDPEGRVTCTDLLMEKIFRGGVEPELRVRVWKYLLSYHQWDRTAQENAVLAESRKDEYYAMKYQWRSMVADQLKRNSVVRDRKLQIDKDVKRTDRGLDFFKEEDGENMAMLFDILMTYTMYNFDLGYVQGMNDLLSPILMLMQSEHDAFWCFAGLMDRMEHNFEYDQAGMKQQLQQLSSLTQTIDEQLFDHLERAESHNMYFCFRWLLLQFKREFSVADSMRMYEVLWTDLPCPNFHLLVAMAMLDGERQCILEGKPELTDILKHINEIAQKIDLERALCVAEGIYKQMRECQDLPDDIVDIFGLNIDNPSLLSST